MRARTRLASRGKGWALGLAVSLALATPPAAQEKKDGPSVKDLEETMEGKVEEGWMKIKCVSRGEVILRRRGRPLPEGCEQVDTEMQSLELQGKSPPEAEPSIAVPAPQEGGIRSKLRERLERQTIPRPPPRMERPPADVPGEGPPGSPKTDKDHPPASPPPPGPPPKAEKAPEGMVAVPDLFLESPSEAFKLLKSLGLQGELEGFVKITKPEWRYRNGMVGEQSPPQKTLVKKGTVVKVKQFQHVGKVLVPRVVGYLLEDAKKLLIDRGFPFTIGGPYYVHTGEDRDAKNGRVAAQSPKANEAVEPGTTVKLSPYVYKDLSKKIILPNLVGMHVKEAMKRCDLLEIRCGKIWGYSSLRPQSAPLTDDPKRHCIVARQTSPPGTYLDRGAPVNLFLYTYPKGGPC